ncbi:hypothetical protein B5M42_001310 [Paenibacillus athensensis]|uniref:Uncharacterized protein n=1 Tax=Paenibacillus athensensis TaxID=1967502 RepID=A0A4Y8QAZ0_9BACL|nr:hypothetical protein [Paenibacillus athensensis]MCD1257475.1 hypothetical protein [Paenibacillus athensensis]
MKLLRAQHGTITVYMLILIIPLLMIAGLLIDLARIRLATNESETALKAGLRSVMAGYDRSLQTFGLWGMTASANSAQQELSAIMSANLSGSVQGGLPLIDTSLENGRARLTPVYSLASQLILRRQLLEAVKWQAPLSFERYVGSALRPVEASAPLADGVKLGRAIKALDKLLDQRNAAGDEAWASLEALYKLWQDDVAALQQQSALLQQAADEPEEREALYVLHARARSLLSQSSGRQQEQLRAAAELTMRAQLANERLQTALADARKQLLPSLLPVEGVLDAVPLYGAFDLREAEDALASLVTRLAAVGTYWDGLSPDRLEQAGQRLAALTMEGTRWHEVNSQADRARQQLLKAADARRRQVKASIQADFMQVDSLAEPPGCAAGKDGFNDAYRHLQMSGPAEEQGLYQKYRSLNGQDSDIGGLAAFEWNQPEAFSLGALQLLDSLLAAAAEELRDDIWIHEYVLTVFSSRTAKSDFSNRRLVGQEAEYVLYGFSGCGANLSAAYVEMFSLRLAVRTVEALLQPDPADLQLGSPMLVLLAASAEGAKQAAADMKLLIDGQAVPFFENKPFHVIQLSYNDYLRIFLLVHSSQTKTLARIQALLELNTGLDLRQASACFESTAQSSIRLWFVPAFAQLPFGSRLLGCELRNQRCVISSTAIWSY